MYHFQKIYQLKLFLLIKIIIVKNIITNIARMTHIYNLNVNSLLPKIDEVNLIANKSNATILGISETKLDNTIMDSELEIEGYDLICSDRNRHGGGVACYIKKDRHYNVRANCPTHFLKHLH